MPIQQEDREMVTETNLFCVKNIGLFLPEFKAHKSIFIYDAFAVLKACFCKAHAMLLLPLRAAVFKRQTHYRTPVGKPIFQ